MRYQGHLTSEVPVSVMRNASASSATSSLRTRRTTSPVVCPSENASQPADATRSPWGSDLTRHVTFATPIAPPSRTTWGGQSGRWLYMLESAAGD